MMKEAQLAHDRLAIRDRPSRAVFFALAVAFALLAPVAILSYLAPHFLWIGIAFGGSLALSLLPKLMFHVPTNQALVSFNPINGQMVSYGPGWHPRFPWEEVTAQSNLPLREIAE